MFKVSQMAHTCTLTMRTHGFTVPVMDKFRALLRAHLQKRGDLARLSEASGLHGIVIKRWIDTTMRPSPENLEKLAPAVGVPYEDLLRMCGYLPTAQADRPAPEASALVMLKSRWPVLEDWKRRAICELAGVTSGQDLTAPQTGFTYAVAA